MRGARGRGPEVQADPLRAAAGDQRDPAPRDLGHDPDWHRALRHPAPPEPPAIGRRPAGIGRRGRRNGAPGTGAADVDGLRRRGAPTGDAIACWSRSWPRWRDWRASTCCASTRPGRSPNQDCNSRTSRSSPTCHDLTSSRSWRPPRPPTRRPTRRSAPWRRSGAGESTGWRVRSQVPFSCSRKWSAVSFVDHGSWVLGASQVVLPEDESGVMARAREHERSARRVLILARAPEPVEVAPLPPTLEPVALISWRSSCARTRRQRCATSSSRG